MVYLAKEYGLRPAVIMTIPGIFYRIREYSKVLQDTGVDLETYVIDNIESNDIFRSFFLAGVPELGTPTDLALVEVLNRVAARYGINMS